MSCELMRRPGQTLTERKAEVKKAVSNLEKLIVSGQVRVKVGQQGAVAFSAWADVERAGVTDACAYRMLMVTGSALAKAKVAQAEMLAGRSVNRQVIGQGVHSHDGGKTWHEGH